MKIKLMLFLILGIFTTSIAQPEEKGWDEGVAAVMVKVKPSSFKEIPNIYVGNLAKSWRGHSKKNSKLYANKEKNLFSLLGTTFSKNEIAIPASVDASLKSDKNLKVFLSKKKLYVVNERGEVVKKMKR